MYEVMIQERFSAAHQLREYGGKCEKLHGHNYKVDVVVEASGLNDAGLALDFRILRERTLSVLAEMDHAFLNELAPFLKINPSSENIARHIFESLAGALGDEPVRLKRVSVWESDHSCASYTGEPR